MNRVDSDSIFFTDNAPIDCQMLAVGSRPESQLQVGTERLFSVRVAHEDDDQTLARRERNRFVLRLARAFAEKQHLHLRV